LSSVFGRTRQSGISAGAALVLGVIASWQAAAPGATGGAELMPLAAESLLLDGAVLGDRIIAVGERGHILVSDDRGQTWTQVETPTRSTLTAVTAVDRRHAWAVGHDGVILHSRDGGSSWVRQFYAPDGERPLLDVWFADPEQGLAVGAYGTVMATVDGGETWQRSLIDPEEPHANAITRASDGTLYVAAEFGLVLRSDDGGATFARLPSPYAGSFFGLLALRDGALLIFGLRGHLYRSTDRGAHWHRIQTGTSATLLTGVQRSDGTVLIAGLDGALLVSGDGGRTFERHQLPDRRGIAAMVEIAPDRLLLLGEHGMHTLSALGTPAKR
jgi:photosystem II stability/assembly factor-like uncharacterized protein